MARKLGNDSGIKSDGAFATKDDAEMPTLASEERCIAMGSRPMGSDADAEKEEDGEMLSKVEPAAKKEQIRLLKKREEYLDKVKEVFGNSPEDFQNAMKYVRFIKVFYDLIELDAQGALTLEEFRSTLEPLFKNVLSRMMNKEEKKSATACGDVPAAAAPPADVGQTIQPVPPVVLPTTISAVEIDQQSVDN